MIKPILVPVLQPSLPPPLPSHVLFLLNFTCSLRIMNNVPLGTSCRRKAAILKEVPFHEYSSQWQPTSPFHSHPCLCVQLENICLLGSRRRIREKYLTKVAGGERISVPTSFPRPHSLAFPAVFCHLPTIFFVQSSLLVTAVAENGGECSGDEGGNT